MTIRRTADDVGSEASQGAQSAQTPHRETRIAAAVRHLSRRDFLRRAAGAGIALGMAPVLGGCGGDDTPADSGPPPGKERRALFFNLSLEAHAGRTYYLTGGGNRYALVPVQERPDVLARGRLARLVKSSLTPDQILEELYLATLTRLPTTAEREAFQAYCRKRRDRRTVCADALWALINTREFILNH